MKTAIMALTTAALAACVSSGTGNRQWDPDAWMRQGTQDVSSGGWNLSASPLGEDGFKLKLTLKTDGLFRGASGEDRPGFEALEAAAIDATPTGCDYLGLELTADGGAVADYDCSEIEE